MKSYVLALDSLAPWLRSLRPGRMRGDGMTRRAQYVLDAERVLTAYFREAQEAQGPRVEPAASGATVGSVASDQTLPSALAEERRHWVEAVEVEVMLNLFLPHYREHGRMSPPPDGLAGFSRPARPVTPATPGESLGAGTNRPTICDTANLTGSCS